eukprot:scaffold20690_cov155-Skeletonema_dohrnii-CCMP3373.AAC.8
MEKMDCEPTLAKTARLWAPRQVVVVGCRRTLSTCTLKGKVIIDKEHPNIMSATTSSLANNSNRRHRFTKVGQTLRNQRSSSSRSNSSDLQIEHDYQRELEQVLLLDEERALQLERHSRLCSPSQYQQHRRHHEQQRDVSLDYNDEVDSLVYSVSVNSSTATAMDTRSASNRMVSPIDRMKMNLMRRIQDDDEVVSVSESKLDDTVMTECTEYTTQVANGQPWCSISAEQSQNDDATVNVASNYWMCVAGFLGRIMGHSEDTTCEAREAMLGSMLPSSSATDTKGYPGGKKDDMSAITRSTAYSTESDISELTDHIKQIMAYSARRSATSSARTLAEKLEAVNRSSIRKMDTLHEVEPATKKGRKEASRNKVGSKSKSSFWQGDGVWSSDQSTAFGGASPSTQYHLRPRINEYDQVIASSRFLSFTEEATTETNQPEANVIQQVSRQADIKEAYAQAKQGKAIARSYFWQGDGVWSSDQSTAFGSLHSTQCLRPRITEYDEAVTSARYLAYAEKVAEEQEADASNCWMSAIDVSSGKTYYYHIETRETSWSMPVDYNGSVGSHSSTSRIQKHHKIGAFSEERDDSIESRASVDADILMPPKKKEERDQDWISPTKQRRRQHHPATKSK